SSGLGAHFARMLADEGASVVLAARRVEVLDALKAEIEAAGGKAQTVALDVSVEGSVEAAFADLDARGVALDIVVNNAGISGTAPAISMSADDWDSVVDTNLKGVFLVAQA